MEVTDYRSLRNITSLCKELNIFITMTSRSQLCLSEVIKYSLNQSLPYSFPGGKMLLLVIMQILKKHFQLFIFLF